MTHEEQFGRNLKHAFALFDFLLDNPNQIDTISDGMTIVSMPSNDPDLCAANEAMLRAFRLRNVIPQNEQQVRSVLSNSTLLVNI